MSSADTQVSIDVKAGGDPLRPPAEARRRADRLLGKLHDRERQSVRLARDFETVNAYLAIAGQVTEALDALSEQLFSKVLRVVEETLTIALQEILEQPIRFRAEADFKRGAAAVDFWIDRGGNREHVLLGQGGSVANILSVGLRMFALTTLDGNEHRPFLVLDEQDCWLRPDLVPKLVKMVHDAGRTLGFQVLMISHHDAALFERYADRIYKFTPCGDGTVNVQRADTPPAETDREE